MSPLIPWPILAAGALDALVGDPPRPTHPVVLIGRLVTFLERHLYRPKAAGRLAGILLVALTVGTTLGAGVGLLSLLFHLLPPLGLAAAVWLLQTTISARDLAAHAILAAQALAAGDIRLARQRTALMVGRETEELPAEELARAVVESVAENTADGVVAPLFYASLGWLAHPFGLPPLGGAVAFAIGYKAVNTLDAMVGYTNDRYLNFGWASARLDDVLNLLPSRLTALFTALAAPFVHGSPAVTLAAALRHGARHPSPNAGYPEAAFAGALGLRLGGQNRYHGRVETRPYLGWGHAPRDAADIGRAVRLMAATSVLAFLAAAGALTR